MRIAVLIAADIVHIEDVDARQAEPLQAVFERPHDAVVGIVVGHTERQRMLAARLRRRLRKGAQQPPDLGRQHPFVARLVAQRIADRPLRLPKAVIRCGIDIAHPGIPSGAHDRLGPLPGHRDAGAAQRGAAEPQNRHFQRGPPDPTLLEFRHRVSPAATTEIADHSQRILESDVLRVDQLQSVIPGLDPGIHGFSLVDGRVKPGHDE